MGQFGRAARRRPAPRAGGSRRQAGRAHRRPAGRRPRRTARARHPAAALPVAGRRPRAGPQHRRRRLRRAGRRGLAHRRPGVRHPGRRARRAPPPGPDAEEGPGSAGPGAQPPAGTAGRDVVPAHRMARGRAPGTDRGAPRRLRPRRSTRPPGTARGAGAVPRARPRRADVTGADRRVLGVRARPAAAVPGGAAGAARRRVLRPRVPPRDLRRREGAHRFPCPWTNTVRASRT